MCESAATTAAAASILGRCCRARGAHRIPVVCPATDQLREDCHASLHSRFCVSGGPDSRQHRPCRSSADHYVGGGEYDLRHLPDRGQKGAWARAGSNFNVRRFRQKDGDCYLRSRQDQLGETHPGHGRSRLSLKSHFETVSTVILESVLTCPSCVHARQEIMPTDACQYFYECTQCKTLLKPKAGDCCVFCSYGSIACPPIQEQRGCCH